MTISHTWQTSITWIAQHWLLERLFFSSIELAVLAVGAALFIQLMKPRTPRLVALVWALVLIKPIVSLMAGSPLNLLEIDVPMAPQAVVTAPVEHPEDIGRAVLPADQVPIEPRAFSSRPDALPQTSVSRQSNAPMDPSFEVLSSIPIASYLLGMWFAGLALMFLKSIRARWQLARMLAACRVPEAGTADFYKGISATMAVRRLPRLLLTDAIESPALVGLWKPIILVPAWLAGEAHRPALAWSLRHELTHWKHGDAWLIRVRELGELLFFFHPAAWFAGRRLAEAMEIACDRAVIVSEADAADYARRLYEILEMVRGARQQPVAGGLFATRTQIAKRFAALMHSPLRLRPRMSAWSTVSMIVLAAVVLGVGAGLRRESQAEEKATGRVTSEDGKPVANQSKGDPELQAKAEQMREQTRGITQHSPGVKSDGTPEPEEQRRLEMARQQHLEAVSRAIRDRDIQWRRQNKENVLASDFAPREKGGVKTGLADAVSEPAVEKKTDAPDHTTISGTCVDENGKPIADARVRLFIIDVKGAVDFYAPPSQRQLQDVRTDKHGKFSLARLDPQKYATLVLAAQSPGKATASQNVWQGKAMDASYEFKLLGAATLRGRVRDVNGKPVAGAVVEARSIGLIEPVPGIRCAVTDANGRYEITDVRKWLTAKDRSRPGSNGEYGRFVWVRHPDYARQVFLQSQPSNTFDAKLQRRADVAGQVVSAKTGQPIAKARVEFSSEPLGIVGDWWTSATTDAEGRYRLEILPPGQYNVAVLVPLGRPVDAGPVKLKVGKNSHNMRINEERVAEPVPAAQEGAGAGGGFF